MVLTLNDFVSITTARQLYLLIIERGTLTKVQLQYNVMQASQTLFIDGVESMNQLHSTNSRACEMDKESNGQTVEPAAA
jgi:hypothetical protein